MSKGTVLVLLVAASSLSRVSQADDLAATCESHFTQAGSFLTGKKASTWLDLAGVAKSDAYSRILVTLNKDGWAVQQQDKDAGIINASQQVSFGKGAAAPLSVVIESADAGSKATITFSTAGGQMASKETMKTKMCAYLVAAVK
jgi:hypothetical protein